MKKEAVDFGRFILYRDRSIIMYEYDPDSFDSKIRPIDITRVKSLLDPLRYKVDVFQRWDHFTKDQVYSFARQISSYLWKIAESEIGRAHV